MDYETRIPNYKSEQYILLGRPKSVVCELNIGLQLLFFPIICWTANRKRHQEKK